MWGMSRRWWGVLAAGDSKRQRYRNFGIDLSYEFHAPSFLLSPSNARGLRVFIACLVKDVGMEAMGECVIEVESDNEDASLNGPTVMQAIKTSAIIMHLWPGIGPQPGIGYGRLTISTCKPGSLNELSIYRRLKLTLRADVFSRSVDRWSGPNGSPHVFAPARRKRL